MTTTVKMGTPAVSAIVLAGGGARRLDGADKPGLSIGGQPLFDRIVSALAAVGIDDIVSVGPTREHREVRVRYVRESPEGGGPAAALAEGLRAIGCAKDAVALVIAADMPSATGVLGSLAAHAQRAVRAGRDGSMTRADGHDQFLLFAATRGSLKAAIGSESMEGMPMRLIIDRLDLDRFDISAEQALDVDTWDAVVSARKAVRAEEGDVSESGLDAWIVQAAELAGVDPESVDVDAILDLARDAAHGVARPAAPITTFLLGYAAAAQGLDAAGVAAMASRLGSAAKDAGS